jgi:3-phenylpropionate/trans-cinnamate dioxygenase ferredoxin reductase subunit
VLGSDDTVLVVGGGAAGHSCVRAYREAGGDRPVVLVSADDRIPYFRPHVSKGYLTGEVGIDELPLAPAGWYDDHDVTVLLGADVVGLDLAARVAATDHGPISWGDCVLATGSGPSVPPVPGADAPGVQTIRAAVDAEQLVGALGGPVVVVGSGFVGCEVAASLRARGVPVTMVSEEPLPQGDRLGPDVGRLIGGWLHDAGVHLVGGHRLERIRREGDTLLVDVGGVSHLASLVVMAVGSRPRLGIPAGVGLAGRDGVTVDATMRTAAPHVMAAGDIAIAHHATAGRELRVEHWGDAVAQGRVAGLTLAGQPARWTTPPGFWSTIAGRTLKHVAWGDGYDAAVATTRGDGTTVWYGRDGVVVGVLTHDHDEDNERAAAALAERWTFPPR